MSCRMKVYQGEMVKTGSLVLIRGYFPWPMAKDGVAHLTQAPLSMLVEGIDWRRPAWAYAKLLLNHLISSLTVIQLSIDSSERCSSMVAIVRIHGVAPWRFRAT